MNKSSDLLSDASTLRSAFVSFIAVSGAFLVVDEGSPFAGPFTLWFAPGSSLTFESGAISEVVDKGSPLPSQASSEIINRDSSLDNKLFNLGL